MWLRILSVVGFVAVWQLIAWAFALPTYLLPTPLETAVALVEDVGIIAGHLVSTVVVALSGLGLSVLVGVVVAVMMSLSRTLGELIYANMVLSQAIPLIALAPLILLWFGFGWTAKILIVVVVCFFPIAVNTYEGFRTVQRDQLELMASLEAGPWQRYVHLLIPASLPGAVAGLKIAATYSLIGAVVGEWIGGSKGMGIYMTRVHQSYRTDRMFAAILVVMLTSYLAFQTISWVGRRLTPWMERR